MQPQRQHILIIDDDAARRASSQQMLLEEGFGATAVGDGFSAVRLAAEDQFDLVVTAVELPGCVDGATAIRHIRGRQPWVKALFTGSAAACDWSALRDGDNFIAAPYDRRALVGCIFELLQRPPVSETSRAG